MPARRSLGAPVFPNILSSVGAIPPSSVSLQFADPKGFRNPYSQQGTLALEHQFTRDVAVTASYIWSRGIAIFTQRDLNLGRPPVTTPTPFRTPPATT